MLQLENSELLMSRVGKETYYTLIKNVIKSLSNFIDKIQYLNNYKKLRIEVNLYLKY